MLKYKYEILTVATTKLKKIAASPLGQNGQQK